MRISVVLGHPNPGSFCHAVTEAVGNELLSCGHHVIVHDLQREGFDPIVGPDEARTRRSNDPLVEAHCAELAAAHGLVVVHPSWWGMPPAILKGWIDRVVRPGVAYELRPDATGALTKHVGLLTGRKALVICTSDLPPDVETGKFGDTLAHIWKTYVGALSGLDVHRISLAVMGTSTAAQRRAWLDDVRRETRRQFPASVVAG